MMDTPVWRELRWILPRERAEGGSAALLELGAEGVQEDYLPGQTPPPRQPWDLGPPSAEPPLLLLRAWWIVEDVPDIATLLERWGGSVEWAEVATEDWEHSWQDHFVRVVISDRLVVAPPWEAQPGDLVLEPGMAFGSGDHPTTRACLEGVERYARPRARCLDVGCGSGILALAAAHLGMAAEGIDIDPAAVSIAQENAARAGLAARFSAASLATLQETYDLVLANVYAEVLVDMAADLARLCAAGGHVVLAGILADRDGMVFEAMARVGLQVVRTHNTGEWVSLELAKPLVG